MKPQTALVVDFGGQYAQLIVRRIREFGCYSELVPWASAAEWLKAQKPDAVILSGGPRSVLESDSPTMDFKLIEGVPTLGICYGHQLMANVLGGKVHSEATKEYGRAVLTSVREGSLVSGLEGDQVWMSHGDQVESAPPGFNVTASTDTCPVTAMEDPSRGLFGVQFHPEVSHTQNGKKILERFLLCHAGLKSDWTSENFIEEAVTDIREQVGDGQVLCAVSGGVDSSVMAALLTRAIGDRAVCVFVDHGLLRKGESDQVVDMFTKAFHPRLIKIEAQDQFFTALKGVSDPETKRKVIGAEFVRCFEDHAEEFKECKWLAQGTLYPDVIESGSDTAAKIKTHHNVGGLPDWMKLKVIEPLRWLFKDEVRDVGRQLGLPESVVERQPFPGPGLAVRILGEVTPERVAVTQEADSIFREEIEKAGLERSIWQSYAALLNVQSVGVMGDDRTYENPVVLRAVTSEDAMTAKAFNFDFAFLEHVCNRIVNEVDGVNRVLYDLTSKPPATIEWE